MRRTMNYCLIGFTLIVCVSWSLDTGAAAIASLHPKLRRQAAELERLKTEIHDFGEHMDYVACEVAGGRISLRNASQSLEQYIAARCPTYFTGVSTVEPQRSVGAKLAFAVFRHLQIETEQGVGRIDPDRWGQLSSEYEAIMGEEGRLR